MRTMAMIIVVLSVSMTACIQENQHVKGSSPEGLSIAIDSPPAFNMDMSR